MTKLIKLSDISVEVYDDTPRGGMRTGMTPKGVIAVHIPTGIGSVSKGERSQFRNKVKAIKGLELLLESNGYVKGH